MAREKKPVNWGSPGETGVTEDGVPWYVPEGGPSLFDRALAWTFRGGESTVPIRARRIPASTASDLRERLTRKYHDQVAAHVGLAAGEKIEGFAGFTIDEHVPQPPFTGAIGRKIGPLPVKKWWMGGDWDSTAGKLIRTIGREVVLDTNMASLGAARHQTWVRTSHRIVILGEYMDSPKPPVAEYQLNEVGLYPGWQPYDPAKGYGARVDIAFADGSWLGIQGHSVLVPGGTKGHPERDLLAELAGPPVTSAVLPDISFGQ